MRVLLVSVNLRRQTFLSCVSILSITQMPCITRSPDELSNICSPKPEVTVYLSEVMHLKPVERESEAAR